MKNNEKYWLDLYKEGKIEINFETGEVFSFLTGKRRLLTGRHFSGYLSATAGISRKNRNNILLHRLIWIIANGNIPDKIEINHKNGVKNDNRLCNLELTTKSENAIHSHRILGNKGGCLKGEKHLNAKLKEWQVLEIRNKYCKGKTTLKFLAKEYGVNFSTIADILRRKSWKEI